jgi:hypothetical protein
MSWHIEDIRPGLCQYCNLCVPRTPSRCLSSRFPEVDLNIANPTRASMIAQCGLGLVYLIPRRLTRAATRPPVASRNTEIKIQLAGVELRGFEPLM